ncbi:hypothetical protein FRC03_006277 [Tulasnella sp. 419]|nr:hypothetical protein FRC03_006277 [Tulasnella sp. 419]
MGKRVRNFLEQQRSNTPAPISNPAPSTPSNAQSPPQCNPANPPLFTPSSPADFPSMTQVANDSARQDQNEDDEDHQVIPSSVNRRRHRSDDEDENEESSVVRSRPNKRKVLTYARDKAANMGMVESHASELEVFAQLDAEEMLIDIKANLIVLQHSITAADAEKIVNSAELKERLNDRFWFALLSPTISSYVTNLRRRMFVSVSAQSIMFTAESLNQDVIRENPDSWKVPSVIFKDPTLSKKFSTVISKILTQIRSRIKQNVRSDAPQSISTWVLIMTSKLTTSIATETDIHTFSHSIKVVGMEVTLAFYHRMAFLRNCLIDSNAETSTGISEAEKVNKYWKHVDSELEDLRTEVNALTVAQRVPHVLAFYTGEYQEDIKRFAPKTMLKNHTPSISSFQASMQKIVEWK